MIEPRQPISFLQFENGNKKELSGSTIQETPVALTVNGEVWTTFMCTPSDLEHMMIGFLFNEGVIDTREQVADVRTCDHGDNVDVWLNQKVEKPESWTRTSGCTGGVTAVELVKRPQPVSVSEPFKLLPSQIVNLVEKLFDAQRLYRETGGVHTSALSDGRDVILSAEDIGRHNSLDKVTGMALMKDLWPDRRILATTGRISSEMLQKAARMGVNILVSRTSPTSLSIQLAQAWDITLIGYARRARFNVYAHPERILTEEIQPS
jgi:FdhD protein